MTDMLDDFTIDELHAQCEAAYNEANRLYGTPEYPDAIDRLTTICDELIRRAKVNNQSPSLTEPKKFEDLEQLEVSLRCYELCSNVSRALQVIEELQLSLAENVALRIIKQARDRLINAVELCEEWRHRAGLDNNV